jgi:hypothetical protein
VFGRLFGRHPLAANVDDALGVAHDEGPQLEPEEPAVADGQVVDARDPHRARLGVQAGRKGSECVHAATDAILGFQDERVVALPRQLEGGDQTRDAGADDDDPLGRLIARLQTFPGSRERRRVGRRSRHLRLGRQLVEFVEQFFDADAERRGQCSPPGVGSPATPVDVVGRSSTRLWADDADHTSEVAFDIAGQTVPSGSRPNRRRGKR